ncbi:hypothetical protein QYM36_008544 [Artemia franciscana]|uniref:Uncharacterized protein n=1 Tax=Artemia franciscana TaxID=6661 RepID=A0AA88LE29_ARTSF|nr:hypothetical protein QYM36_008544 [Artemia franciscana]
MNGSFRRRGSTEELYSAIYRSVSNGITYSHDGINVDFDDDQFFDASEELVMENDDEIKYDSFQLISTN